MFQNIKIRINQMNESNRRLIKGSSWMLFGSVLSKVLVFFATILVARILTKEVYGELGIIRSTIQMFVAVSAFGIGSTATKHIAEYRQSNPAQAVKIYCIANIFVFCIALLAMCVLMFTSEGIAKDLLNEPSLTSELRIASAILFFSLLNGAQSGALAGFEDFHVISKSNILNGVLEIMLLPAGAYLWGLTGAVLGFGACFLGVFLYNHYYLSKEISKFRISILEQLRSIEMNDFKIILTFSLPIALSSWIIMLTYWFTKTLMIKSIGFGAMANYDVAEQFKNQMLFLPGILAQVLLPIMANNLSGGNRNTAIQTARNNIKINVTLMILIFIGIIFLGKFLLSLYGKDYTNLFPLYVLCFCAIIDSISNSLVPIIIASNKVWQVIAANVLWSISILLAFTLLNKIIMSENALALAYLCATIIQTLYLAIFLRTQKLL